MSITLKKICEKIFPIGIGDGSFLFPSAFISTPSNSQVGYSDSHGNPISIMNPIPTVTSSKRLSLSHVCDRLCQYFDGRHHLEEMMFYENIRRSQLLIILDKFYEILVVSHHEEPSISYWLYS